MPQCILTKTFKYQKVSKEIMNGKMIHLRLSEPLCKEANELIPEFGFKNIQEFISEAIRNAVEQYKLKRDIRGLRKLMGSVKNVKRHTQEEMEQHALSMTPEKYAEIMKKYGF